MDTALRKEPGQAPPFLLGTLAELPPPEKTDVQVTLVTERCCLRLMEQDITCSPGNILVTGGNPFSRDGPVPPLRSLLLRDTFFDSLFLFQMTDCPLFHDFLRTRPGSPRLFHFDCFPTEIYQTIAQVLFFEAAKGPESVKTVHAACTLLFTNLQQIHRERLLIGHSTMMTEHKIGEVLTYMSNHYQYLTLESTAEAFHYHPSYFSSWFKKHANITFQKQLLKLKLEQSKFLLRETSLPVQTIVEEIGFREKSYFHRCFKREYGMTPLAYRRMPENKDGFP